MNYLMSAKIFCPKCGSENEKLDTFCSSCGTVLNESQITESLTTPNIIEQQITSEVKFEAGSETKTSPSIVRRKNNM